MRNFLCLAFLFFAALTVNANNESIKFYEASWTETTTKAKESGKYVFLDCYTDWCYWCKVMDKETFMDTSVSNMINGKFVPARREMEKSEEGKALSMKYHVSGFPTYMIFNGEGQLVYQIVGYRVAAEFKTELEKALLAKTPLCPGFSTALDPGFPDFYKKSFGTNKERKKSDPKVVNEWLDKQTDLFSEVSWAVMWRFTVNEKYENFILENNTKLSSLYGEDEVSGKIRSIISYRAKSAGEKNDRKALEDALSMIPKYIPADTAWLVPQLKYNFYRDSKDWNGFAAVIQASIDTGGYESWMINDGSWTIYEQCDDKAIVKRSIVWMDSLTTIHPAYASLDTYAALLYKDGQYKKAEEVALHAIDLGKEAGDDVSGTEALLANIRLKIK